MLLLCNAIAIVEKITNKIHVKDLKDINPKLNTNAKKSLIQILIIGKIRNSNDRNFSIYVCSKVIVQDVAIIGKLLYCNIIKSI